MGKRKWNGEGSDRFKPRVVGYPICCATLVMDDRDSVRSDGWVAWKGVILDW